MYRTARVANISRWLGLGFVLLSAFTRADVPIAEIDLDLRAPQHPFPHFWEDAFGSGRAILTLRESYRDDLRSVHAVTGFHYARFHEIFEDDLNVYDEDPHGNPVYNFTLVDQVYDGLLANGVRPIVEIGFMPKKMAARQDLHAFWDKPVVSPPKDWAHWDNLVRAFAAHLIERYGVEEVSQWYFEVWNEPNIDFWTGNPKLATYLELYAHTAMALRSVNGSLRVGGPATSAAHWIPEFLEYAKAHDVPVDFVSTHGYADDSAEDLFGVPDAVPMDERVCRAVAKVRSEIESSGRPGLPLFWTEWNVPSYGDTVQARDSAYVGAAVAETVRQCDGRVQLLAYWTLSDVFDENGPGRRPFTGSFGLIGLGGIHKPSWTAFALLHRLGNVRLENASPGVLLTARGSGQFAAAIWNLRDPGSPQLDREVNVRLRSPQRWREVWVTIVDDTHGSSRAAYQAMGSPRYPTPSQVAALNRAAEVPRPMRVAVDRRGAFKLHLAANGLALIETRPTTSARHDSIHSPHLAPIGPGDQRPGP
jgi:xylan 1,4-beta-xylosidase